MRDGGQARKPFDELWDEIPGREQLTAAGVLDTVKASIDTRVVESELPEVGHLTELGHELGRGGHGEVLSATQLGLNRKIAIKRPLAGESSDALAEVLLEEARVLSYLEHPNVPPVYFAGSSDVDQLLAGLKRIEGETFSSRLQGQSGLDNLDENLEILIQVSNAIDFAHSRGILHLDLKPGNIMTGKYGEVYVLDWGLAVAFREDAPAHLPRPPSEPRCVGTPAYMAPETLVGKSATEATDIYQLGGLLHSILTKKPPNSGDRSIDALRASYDPPKRSFHSGVPRALAEICIKALSIEPADRHRDVAHFREDLISFRRDKLGLEALASAQLLAEEFLGGLADAVDNSQVYQSYGRVRQGLDHAIALQPIAGSAEALLQRVLEGLIHWELSRGNAGSAEFLVSELPTANEAIAALVAEGRAQQASQVEELHTLRDHNDPSLGSSSKVALLLFIGITIAMVEIVPVLLGIAPSAGRILMGYGVYFVLMLAGSVLLRKQLFLTRLNRGLILMLWGLSIFGLAIRIGTFRGLLSLEAAVAYDLTLVTLGTLYVTAQLDRRFGYVVPSYGIASFACFIWPDQVLLFFGAAHLLGMSMLAFAVKVRPDSAGVALAE